MSDDGVTSGPIDVGAVSRDDAFLDNLAAGRAANVADSAEYELAGLIAQWRVDSISSPIPTTPTVADIEAAISRANARERRGGLSRRLRVVSGAAAVLAVVGAGLLVMSEGSQPGDPLWSVKQVVFAEQAQQTQAKVNAEANIQAAKEALKAGDVVKAKKYIEEAEKDVGPINDKSEVADLREVIDDIRDRTLKELIPRLSSLPKLPPSTTTVSPTEEKPNPTVLLESPTPSTSTSKPSTPPSESTTKPSKPSKPSEPSKTTEPSSTTPTASGTAETIAPTTGVS
ncbi:anti-sigma-D factor RsdA [Gordonia phthalatica]|uniref:anti-sigma-D factor RsdA n=1 Tax=Gordonia phthalatica TaxID=1136941 RepID=UPI0009E7A882|nr:anti-sigma-D factor RsdA [Gordonia phthalatica]